MLLWPCSDFIRARCAWSECDICMVAARIYISRLRIGWSVCACVVLQRFAEFLQRVVRKRRAHAQYGGRSEPPLSPVNEVFLPLRTLLSGWLHCMNDRSTVKFDFLTVLVSLLFKYSQWAWLSATLSEGQKDSSSGLCDRFSVYIQHSTSYLGSQVGKRPWIEGYLGKPVAPQKRMRTALCWLKLQERCKPQYPVERC